MKSRSQRGTWLWLFLRLWPNGGRLRERRRRRRRLVLLRQTHLRRVSGIPLERHVRCSDSEMSVCDLLKVVIAGLNPEMHRVERIREAHRDAHVVTIDLLAKRDVGHLHRGEASLFDIDRRAVEVVRLDCHRRTQLCRGIETIGPGHRVRLERRLRASVGYHLEDVESTKRTELGAKPQVAVEIGAPRIRLVEILEVYRSDFTPVDCVGSVDVDANDVGRVTIERRQLQRAELPRLAHTELERVRVLWIQAWISDQHVLLVEEHRERVQLLGSRPPNPPRVAELDLTLFVRLEHDDAAREQAVVVVRNTLRAGEIEVSVRPFSAQAALQIELADALADHSVAGVYVLVELELVAQIALDPIAGSEIV